MADIVIVPAGDLDETSPTPGMIRRDAQAAGRVRVIELTTPPGSVSGWHHHAEHETAGYVLEGRLRLEWGPGGARSLEGGPGSFFYVPPWTVHRESNPDTEPQRLVAVRFGTGEQVVNVDDPDAGR